MAPTGDGLAPFPRRTAFLVLGLAAVAVAWHVFLPVEFRRPSAYVGGPLPAVAGVGFGLWLTRAENLRMQILGALAWGFVALLASIVVLGLVVLGPLTAAKSLADLLRNGFRWPLSTIAAGWGNAYRLWLCWLAVETVLMWAAVAYGLILHGHRLPGFVGFQLRGLRDQLTMSIAVRKEAVKYRSLYAEAVRRGDAPPVPPAVLSHYRGGIESQARLALLALRAGLAVVGALGLYTTIGTALGNQMASNLGSIFMRGLFGG